MGQDQRHRPQRDAASDRTAWAGLTRRPRRRPGAPPGAARPRARPWGWSALLAVAVAVSSAAALALPATLAAAVDRALSATAGQGILPVAAVLGLLTGAEALAQYAGPRATAEATARLRAALVRHAMALGPHPSRRTTTGDLVARLTASAAEAGLSVQAAVYAVAQLAMAAGSVLALGLLAPELAAAFLITAPAGWLLLRRHLRRTVRRGEGYQSAQAAVATHLLNALAGRRTIAAAGTLECEIERVLRPLPELGRHGRALWDSQRRVSWSTGLLAPATQITVIAVAGHELLAGSLGPGDLVAALGYATLGLGGFGTAQSLLDLARARAGHQRVREVLALTPPSPGLRPLPPGPGRVELRGITVRTPAGDTVLDGLDLVLPARHSVALVGRSGAGTSLLAAVAGGLRVPDRGLVLLDGVPLDDVRPADLRAAVSYAFSDPELTGGTILDALSTAADRVPEERVHAAARAAQADAFVRRLPAGYDTLLTDAPLSGGQRQRLGLARALARDGRLLVLDDAMSSLDSAAEAAVLRALDGPYGDRTRLVVTRRTAAAARADLVAWLHEGRVAALAPHHELWQLPAYRALFDSAEDVDD
ncbi:MULTISPECIES: ATP-binding cassette domain-containing protein [Streptomyces]|nr:ABC transporter ATP-binding protein [Streptomyces scabiei]MDX2657916.1 ABC transporter ATP-binding protein [Streptomyces scabiei]MDX2724556.1 ABC transporter ATP-binding protein [Streptomyces scabiei]MDX2865644.1 ABC transporter ATP-binding protein [Streptomyces scabiei]MDX2888342.1 ABC transporter ATP-binding protein [Streptomyces scabiei]MDX2890789.1 ABC transporter ATP-binding protein [Streptomyces scabiei]